MIHPGQAALILQNLQAQNFARLAFGNDLEGAAANLAIGGKALAGHTGVHHRFKRLAAIGALNGLKNFHSLNLRRQRLDAIQNSRGL